jgi:hypothetical protein
MSELEKENEALQAKLKRLQIENQKLRNNLNNKLAENADLRGMLGVRAQYSPEELDEAWEKWLGFRRKIRKSTDDKEKERLITEAMEHGRKYNIQPLYRWFAEAAVAVGVRNVRYSGVDELDDFGDEIIAAIKEMQSEIDRLRDYYRSSRDPLTELSDEEARAYVPISKKKIDDALAEGKKAADALAREQRHSGIDPKIRFKK